MYVWYLILLLSFILYEAAIGDVAAILYPTGNPTFNYVDDVNITYNTTFTNGAYLVLNCFTNRIHSFWEWVFAPNPRTLQLVLLVLELSSVKFILTVYLHSVNNSGSYLWRSIGVAINNQISLEFPANCFFDLGPSVADSPNPQHVYEGNFTMVSYSASPTTWALATSFTTTNSGTETTSTSLSTSRSEPLATAGTVSSSLSTGAKVGISISAVIGAAIFLGVILQLIRLRRQRAQTKTQLIQLQHERDREQISQKAELDPQGPASRRDWNVNIPQGRIQELSG